MYSIKSLLEDGLDKENQPPQQMAPPSGAARGEEAVWRPKQSDEEQWDEERLLAKYKSKFAFYKRAMGDVLDDEAIAKMAMSKAQ